ncbi:MAG: ABC transporter ATP-binding protein [Nitrososphaerota archaeon]|jgi:energy-coupling factor transporter ATP-binding protein EcfA2|nr:ABC transporter ATP-binding protein [Nitrososphaerota archaeon]
MTTAIEFRDFSFTYEGETSPAARHISLSVESGDILLIAGKSGSGKSTILRAMNGLIPHMYHGKYEGDVLIEGKPVKKTPMSELAKSIGFVFQNPENQIFAFSVERDIAFGLENQGFSPQEIRKRVDWVIKLLGLELLRKIAPFELSDGQKQRTAIAGVLALKPSILILDEPTAVLDPVTARDVLNLIAELNKEFGLTCVIVEHRLELAAPLATKMLVISEGKIMDFGRVEDVVVNPALYQVGISVPPIVEFQKALDITNVKLTVNSFVKEVIKFD